MKYLTALLPSWIARDRNKLSIWRLEITASRWPWQGYGWGGTSAGNNWAPLNQSGARFGAGWRYRFGIDIGGTTVMLNLGWGMLAFRWR